MEPVTHANPEKIAGSRILGGGLRVDADHRVIVYDFRRPDKFSKDQIRTLAVMHETFARQLTAALSSTLRTLAHVHEAAVDQFTYEEFLRSIPNPTVLSIVAMHPLKGAAILQIDPAVTFAVIDRLFGGKGDGGGLKRDITDIECSVISEVVTRALERLREAWAPVIDLQPKLAHIETNPQLAQIVPPSEMVVLVSLEARLGSAQGMLNLCIPFLTIEPIIPRLSAAYIYSERLKAPETSRADAEGIPMTFDVCYEGERLSLGALRRLRRGSLVRMPGYAAGKAFLQAGGAPIFRLSAKRERGARPAVYQIENGPGAAAALRASPAAPGEKSGELQVALQSLSAEMGSALKSVEKTIAELARKQEELSDQLIFQSPDRELAGSEQADAQARPFSSYTISDCDTLAAFLGQEHPQLIAMVLSYLEPGLAACVLSKIPAELQTGVSERICTIDRIAPQVLAEVDRVLKKKLSVIGAEEYTKTGGVETVVGILNVASRSLEKSVVESMEESNPPLAEEIKKRMFVFEDIVLLDRESVGRVLKEAKEEDVLLALKAADEKVRGFVWECVPRGELEKMKSRFEASGRARLSDVDAAQQRIVGVIRTMEEQGKIVVARQEEMIE